MNEETVKLVYEAARRAKANNSVSADQDMIYNIILDILKELSWDLRK